MFNKDVIENNQINQYDIQRINKETKNSTNFCYAAKLSNKNLKIFHNLLISNYFNLNKTKNRKFIELMKWKSMTNKKSNFIIYRSIAFLMYRRERIQSTDLILIYELHVSTDNRNRGIGSKLVNQLVKKIKNENQKMNAESVQNTVQKIILFVDYKNIKAIQFYKKNNFERFKMYEDSPQYFCYGINVY